MFGKRALIAESVRLTGQPLEDRAVRPAQSGRRVKLHHLPSMHHQHPVAVHDGVDPGGAKAQKKEKDAHKKNKSKKSDVVEVAVRSPTCERW